MKGRVSAAAPAAVAVDDVIVLSPLLTLRSARVQVTDQTWTAFRAQLGVT
jgi:hypothetical protein